MWAAARYFNDGVGSSRPKSLLFICLAESRKGKRRLVIVMISSNLLVRVLRIHDAAGRPLRAPTARSRSPGRRPGATRWHVRPVSSAPLIGSVGSAEGVNVTSPNTGAWASRSHNLSPSAKQRLWVARINQSIPGSRCARAGHELVDVALSVGAIDQPGVGQVRGQLGAVLETFQPMHALLGLDRPMPFIPAERRPGAGPQPSIQHTQRHLFRRDRQGVGCTYSPCCRR